MAVVALKWTHCKSFHQSARTAAQCHTGNRRRRTVPATEPNRAAVEIALPYTCATEIRAASEVPSTRGAPAGRPGRSRFGGGDRCGAHAALRSLLSRIGAPSSTRRRLCRHPTAADASRGHRCRPDEDCRQCTPGGCAPRVGLEGNIVILRIIKPICYEDATSCHSYLLHPNLALTFLSILIMDMLPT